MARSFAFLHTVTGLIPTFEELAAKHLPNWAPFNIVDESLLRNTLREGRLTTATMQRVADYLRSAVDGGAEAILVTCSSIGPAVEAAKPFCPVPLVRIDEGMVDTALRKGPRIGVLATVATTLEPTKSLIIERAERQGYNPVVTARVCDGAFEHLSAGRREEHDSIIRDNIVKIANEVDAVVLAQGSMARVATHPQFIDFTTPILSSPELGILHFRSQISPAA